MSIHLLKILSCRQYLTLDPRTGIRVSQKTRGETFGRYRPGEWLTPAENA